MRMLKNLMKGIITLSCLTSAIMVLNPIISNAETWTRTYYIDGDKSKGTATEVITDETATINGNYIFYVTDGYLKGFDCIDYTNQDGNVIIPSNVTVIDENSISNSLQPGVNSPILKKLTIPNTVTAIDRCAISGTELTELTIPSSVKYIGVYALSDNAKLETLTIQEGCTHVDMLAFTGCTSLKTAYLPSTITKMSYNWTDQNPFKGIEKNVTVNAKKGSFVYGYCKNILGMNVNDITPTKPAAVGTFKASKMKATSIQLTWKKAKNASAYYIYQSTNGKSWSKLTETSETSYSVIDLKPATTYKFKIIPVNITNIGSKNGASKTISTYTKTATPNLTSVTKESNKKALLTFDQQSTSKNYEVYASTNGKKFTKVATFKNSSSGKINYTLTKGLKAGKTNYIKIKASTKISGKNIYSDYSDIISIEM